MEDQYGPTLPPGFPSFRGGNRVDEQIDPALPAAYKSSCSHFSDIKDDTIGPDLPPGFKSSCDQPIKNMSDVERHVIGPAMFPRFDNSKRLEPDMDCDSSDNSCDHSVVSHDDSIGPVLPPGFKQCQPSAESVIKGPSLPPGASEIPRGGDSEEEYIVGPLPVEMSRATDGTSVVEEFERRAQNMKDKLNKTEDDSPLQRESWMMELPPEIGANFGLTARKFRTNPSTRGGDRSGWTDTPADKSRKEKETAEGKGKKKKEEKKPVLTGRDKMLAETVDKYNKNKRKESLLDMHQKYQKKKKMEGLEEEVPSRRRPFDRDLDLQVNRFDDAQRKSVIKKSQKLNTRFSHGGSQFM